MNKKKEQTPETAGPGSTEVKVEHIDSEPGMPENEEVPVAEDQEPSDETGESTAEPGPEPEPDWEDRYLRLAAEFDNYKKRSARDFTRIIKNAEGDLILELTEVLDNLERALDPGHRNGELVDFVKGIDLIYDQFKSVLEKRGLTRMEVVGQPFDPEKHEAMMQIDSDEIPEGHITGEVTCGYQLGDRVLRHARVIVSRGPADEVPGKKTEEGKKES